MRMRTAERWLVACGLMLLAMDVPARAANPADWTTPIAPFRIAGEPVTTWGAGIWRRTWW